MKNPLSYPTKHPPVSLLHEKKNAFEIYKEPFWEQFGSIGPGNCANPDSELCVDDKIEATIFKAGTK
jgi:hypothetical protein